MKINIRRILLFLLLVFTLNWGMIGAYLFFGGEWRMPYSLIISVIYMFMPLLAAVMLLKWVYREPLRESLGISFRVNRWFFVFWLLPVIIALFSIGAGLLLPGAEYAPDLSGMFERLRGLLTPEKISEARRQVASFPVHPFWPGLLNGLLAGATVNAIAAFGEEAGWRGFLFHELKPLGFWPVSLVTGLIWGVWHAPVILLGHNYPSHPVAGVFMMTGFTLLISPIFTYARIRSGSVFAAAVFHGTLNGTAGLSVMLIRGGGELCTGVTGIAGMISLVIINILMLCYDRYFAGESIIFRKKNPHSPGKD